METRTKTKITKKEQRVIDKVQDIKNINQNYNRNFNVQDKEATKFKTISLFTTPSRDKLSKEEHERVVKDNNDTMEHVRSYYPAPSTISATNTPSRLAIWNRALACDAVESTFERRDSYSIPSQSVKTVLEGLQTTKTYDLDEYQLQFILAVRTIFIAACQDQVFLDRIWSNKFKLEATLFKSITCSQLLRGAKPSEAYFRCSQPAKFRHDSTVPQKNLMGLSIMLAISHVPERFKIVKAPKDNSKMYRPDRFVGYLGNACIFLTYNVSQKKVYIPTDSSYSKIFQSGFAPVCLEEQTFQHRHALPEAQAGLHYSDLKGTSEFEYFNEKYDHDQLKIASKVLQRNYEALRTSSVIVQAAKVLEPDYSNKKFTPESVEESLKASTRKWISLIMTEIKGDVIGLGSNRKPTATTRKQTFKRGEETGRVPQNNSTLNPKGQRGILFNLLFAQDNNGIQQIVREMDISSSATTQLALLASYHKDTILSTLTPDEKTIFLANYNHKDLRPYLAKKLNKGVKTPVKTIMLTAVHGDASARKSLNQNGASYGHYLDILANWLMTEDAYRLPARTKTKKKNKQKKARQEAIKEKNNLVNTIKSYQDKMSKLTTSARDAYEVQQILTKINDKMRLIEAQQKIIDQPLEYYVKKDILGFAYRTLEASAMKTLHVGGTGLVYDAVVFPKKKAREINKAAKVLIAKYAKYGVELKLHTSDINKLYVNTYAEELCNKRGIKWTRITNAEFKDLRTLERKFWELDEIAKLDVQPDEDVKFSEEFDESVKRDAALAIQDKHYENDKWIMNAL